MKSKTHKPFMFAPGYWADPDRNYRRSILERVTARGFHCFIKGVKVCYIYEVTHFGGRHKVFIKDGDGPYRIFIL